MVSVYTNHLRLEEIGTGEQSGDWGTTTNTNLELIAEAFSYSFTGEAIANSSTDDITVADGASDQARSLYLKLTGGGQACTVTLKPNDLSKVWLVENTTSFTLTMKQGSGATVDIAAGQVKMIATDGQGSSAAVYDLLTDVNLAGTTVATALTVDDVAIDGKVITMTGSTGDTATMTVGTNGTLAVTTTDTAAAAANITITADGTFEAVGTTITLDSGGDIELEAAAGGDVNIPANIGLTFGDDGEKIEGDGTDLTISGNNINLTAVADVNIPSGVGLTFATAEKIESDGTDLSITVGSGGDINIPADIGVTFGDDGEKIEGNGTDLTISSSNDLHLTATTDINVPANVGLTFGDDGEKIEGNGTDLTISSSNDLHLTATTDINIPANVGLTFGDDGEKIEGDGTDLTIAGNNINLTAVADVVVPANVGITFGTGEKIEGDNTDLTVTSGAKINLTATSDVHIPNNVGIVFGGDSEKIEGDGTDMTISANNLTIDAVADIVLDAGGANVTIKDDGTSFLDIANSSTDVELTVSTADKNFKIKGTDSSSAITALDIDMALAGKATFNGDVVIGGDLTISGDDLVMGTNTADMLLIADGTNFNPTAISSLSEISTAADDDVLIAIDTSGGGLKKITRSAIIAGTGASGDIANVVEDTSPQLGGNLDTNSHNILIDDAHFIGDENGNEQIVFQTTSSAVNQIEVTNAASGSGVQIASTGGDTNIDLKLLPKGSGQVVIDGNVGIESGLIDLKNAGAVSKIKFYCESSNAHAQTLQGAPHSEAASNILTLPSTGGNVNLVSTASTATLTNKTFGDNTSFGDNNITNVGDIALDSISADGTDINVAVSDNSATALTIKQGSDAYLIIDTANSSESVSIGTGISGTAITLGHSTSEVTVADNLTVTGNLTVSGTTTTVNSTTVNLNDHNIVLDSGNSTSAVINGAGITIEGGSGDDATFTYNTTGPKFELKLGSAHEDLQVAGLIATTGVFSGILKSDDTTDATSTTDGSLQTDGGLSVAKDAVLGNDVKLLSDAAVLSFGADSEVTLTHVHNDGLLLNADNQLQFRDSAINIRSDADGDLDINADDEIELNSTLIDVNGNLDVSGTIVGASTLSATTGTFSGILKTDDTTEATSTTDGSLQTDGGLSVAKDCVFGDDVKLLSDAAVMSFGADGDITVTHVADVGLNIKNTNTGDDKPIILTLQTGETDLAANEVIGAIRWQAPDEATGTDAVLVSAAIQAVAEGDHSSSSNATKLEFHTGASEAAASKMTLSSGGVLDVDGGITVDNITIDGTEIDLSSGDLTIDVAGDIHLDADGGDIKFFDGGTEFARHYYDSNHYKIYTPTNNGDILFQGTDDSSAITALTLDMSDGGTAIFGNHITLADSKSIRLGAGLDLILTSDGAAGEVASANGNLTLDVAHSDSDMIFKGTDGGADITALTLDMSAAGAATFNDNVTAFSDIRLKSDIQTLENGLEKVEQLRGVTYIRNDNVDGGQQLGVIAQEVEEVFPQVVLTADDERGTKSVDYGRLTGALIEAVKELSAKVKELEARLD